MSLRNDLSINFKRLMKNKFTLRMGIEQLLECIKIFVKGLTVKRGDDKM